MRAWSVVRYGLGRNSTLGLFNRLEGDLGSPATEIAFTLEDERRHTKVYGETCIPTGTYELKLFAEHMDDLEWMNGRYRKRFGDWHKGMIQLQNVPQFQQIYIHILNREDQTKGCIGVGEVPIVKENGEFEIGRSEAAYRKIYEEICPPLIAGEKCLLHVTEMQPWA